MNNDHSKQSKDMNTVNQPSIVDRRTFLKGVGVSLALPFFDSIGLAAAAPAKPPVRMGEPGRNSAQPQYCDACFSGDYPVPLRDHDGGGLPAQLSLLTESV